MCMNLTELYAYPTPFSTLPPQIKIQFNLKTVKLLFTFNSMHLVNLLQPYIQQPTLTMFFFCSSLDLANSVSTYIIFAMQRS